MGLKTVYDNSNKVTDVGLSVTYRQEFAATIDVSGTPTDYWEVARIAKKSYKFVGMDESTAYECASAKRSQYTRSFSRVEITDESVTTRTAIECPSDIAPRHVEGDVWEVQIEVNEMDTTYSIGPAAEPENLFPAANARNYDEDAGSSTLTLGSVTRSGSSLSYTYTQAISGFSPGALVCEYKTSESGAWISAGIGNPVSVPKSALYARIRYGSFESNVLPIT